MASTIEKDKIKVTSKNLRKFAELVSSIYAQKATTLAGYGIIDAATSAQGAKADSAIQKIVINGVEQKKTDGTVDLSELVPSSSADTVQENLTAHTNDKSNPHKVTKAQIGLGNVENKSAATILSGLESSNITTALGFTPMDSSVKGTANGVAELDESGKVPSSQLPSYVDDVIEYGSKDLFPKTGESGKIYVADDTNLTYRWTGSGYTEISPSIALGETSATAYRGDRGKIAYEHSQAAHAPSNAAANVQSDWNVTDTASDAFIKNKPTAMPANGGNAETVNSHTVNADVPENAKFTDTTYSTMTAATTSAAGTAGLVPAPAAGKQSAYLRGDGTWAVPTNTTYAEATTSKAGLMSAADKVALGNKMDADKIITATINVPTSAWAADTTYSEYGYRAIIANTSIAAADNVNIALSVASLGVAEAAYISAGGETYAGGLYLYAKSIPSSALSGTMVIFKG